MDIRNNGILIHADTQHLTLPVHPDDTVTLLVRRGGEDGLARDSVHVDTSASLDFIQVDEPKFGDQVDDAVLLRNLHCDGEIVGGFRREEDIDCFLLEGRIGWLVADLNDVELYVNYIPSAFAAIWNLIAHFRAVCCPYSETEQLASSLRTIHL